MCSTASASGQITMRKVDSWQNLGQAPTDSTIDLAAWPDAVTVPEPPSAISNSLREGTLLATPCFLPR